jgi:hypothetical protein
MTSFLYVIVLFFAVEGATPYQASALTGSYESYEACMAALAPFPGVLPGVVKDKFAGAACVEQALADHLAAVMGQ